ncbi:MAG: chemotaxis protein CheW, partial [Mariprofundaceae bacterium]
VVMEGQDTELDRTILAALKDPLTHIIRNSCDHGIESPEKRRLAGKTIEGTLNLQAKQESGFIIITIQDDGGGISPDIIKTKALSMGVLNERQAEDISDNAALQLIFNAGLSTAEKVSDLSGRGVGMDVVRTEIEKVGGSVDIQSEVGSGTTLRIRIPLTLAIIPTMIVGCGEQRFAIPQMNVKELMSAHADSEHWHEIAGSRFFRVRGRLLPIVNLNDTLKLGLEASKSGSIVLIDTGERIFGIAVDRIYGAEEIVVKPLGLHFQTLDIYNGCSILGDGSVVPILECNALGHLLNLSKEAEAAQIMDDEKSEKTLAEIQHTLIFIQGEQRYAIPLVLVERLEHLGKEQIERSGEHEILQYRGQIIPVLRWKDVLDIEEDEAEKTEHLTCLILSDGIKRMCLQVEGIGEILEIPMEIKMPSDHPLFLGTTVIEGKATEIVDIYEVIKRADPGWFNSTRNGKHQQEQKHILFVEDAPFFRGLLAPMLEAKGYDVWIARDGVEACAILENKVPDLLLTDLEMPNMDGYELAAWVRSRTDFTGMPIIALTSNPPDESETGKRACFDAIMTKEDRPTLMDQFGKILGKASTGGKTDIVHDISPEQDGGP